MCFAIQESNAVCRHRPINPVWTLSPLLENRTYLDRSYTGLRSEIVEMTGSGTWVNGSDDSEVQPRCQSGIPDTPISARTTWPPRGNGKREVRPSPSPDNHFLAVHLDLLITCVQIFTTRAIRIKEQRLFDQG